MTFTTIHDVVRTAAKPHRCIWCGHQIDVGTRYKYVRGIFDGDPQSNHYHLECDKAALAWAREEGGDGEFTPYENERPPITIEPKGAA